MFVQSEALPNRGDNRDVINNILMGSVLELKYKVICSHVDLLVMFSISFYRLTVRESVVNLLPRELS